MVKEGSPRAAKAKAKANMRSQEDMYWLVFGILKSSVMGVTSYCICDSSSTDWNYSRRVPSLCCEFSPIPLHFLCVTYVGEGYSK